MKDFGFDKMINEMLGTDKQEIVSHGTAAMGMILNGLGFVDRPLALTPQFFETCPIDLLLDSNAKPEHMNRHKLGRTLDAISDYGCAKFFNTIAIQVCKLEGVSCDDLHGDATTFSVYGEYDESLDEQEVKIAYGYPKNGRYDLKQILLDLVSVRDGGLPFMLDFWSGNVSDSKVLKKRVRDLVDSQEYSEDARCFIADSKVYSEENIENLSRINFITRIPSTVKYEQELIDRAMTDNRWQELNNEDQFCEYHVKHYGIEQRWIVVCSNAASNRAEKNIEKSTKRENVEIEKTLLHLKARNFDCKADAIAELEKIAKGFKLHKLIKHDIKTKSFHEKPGRPIAEATRFSYSISASFEVDKKIIKNKLIHGSCFVIGTNILSKSLSAKEIVKSYKQQDKVEKCFAFLKSPSFFANSLFLKSTKRIQALITIMVLALLVYKAVQRRIRIELIAKGLTIPNQINKPISNPTLKWIFRCFEGITQVFVEIDGAIKTAIDGLSDVRLRIIGLLGDEVGKIYKIS
jgi:transposase